MTKEELEARLSYLQDFINAPRWAIINTELDAEIAILTKKLVAENNEQTRGAIKALLKFKGMRESFEVEHAQIVGTLSE